MQPKRRPLHLPLVSKKSPLGVGCWTVVKASGIHPYYPVLNQMMAPSNTLLAGALTLLTVPE